MKRVYIFLADGFEEVEALTVVDILRRGQIDLVMVSVSGNREVEGSHGIAVRTDMLFDESDFSDADMLVLPGGMPGTKHLREHEGLAKVLLGAAEAGTRIAAICAAPTVLGGLGLLKGKKAVCYPGLEDKLTGAEPGEKSVVVSGNITTSKGVGTALPFALELLKQLAGAACSEKMAESVIFSGQE